MKDFKLGMLLLGIGLVLFQPVSANATASGANRCEGLFVAQSFHPVARDLLTGMATYVPARNNRLFLIKAIEQIGSLMGVKAKIGFGAPEIGYEAGLAATPGKIHIPEARLERLLLVGQTPEEQLSFLVAHELAHIALKHTEIHLYAAGISQSLPPQVSLRSHDSRKISLEMESQADMIAAEVIARLGLDGDAVIMMLRRFPEMHGGDYYPSLETRVGFVENASNASQLSTIPRAVIDDNGRLDQFLDLIDHI